MLFSMYAMIAFIVLISITAFLLFILHPEKRSYVKVSHAHLQHERVSERKLQQRP